MNVSILKDRASTVLLMVSLCCVTAGCELLGNTSTADSDLSVQKRIWNSYNTGTYSFVLFRSCFCIYAGEYQIFVQDNQIDEIIPAWDDLRGVPKDDYVYFQTIDAIFVLLEQAYAAPADDIEIAYSSHGYPHQVAIDYIKQAVDDELSLTVSDLVMDTD